MGRKRPARDYGDVSIKFRVFILFIDLENYDGGSKEIKVCKIFDGTDTSVTPPDRSFAGFL